MDPLSSSSSSTAEALQHGATPIPPTGRKLPPPLPIAMRPTVSPATAGVARIPKWFLVFAVGSVFLVLILSAVVVGLLVADHSGASPTLTTAGDIRETTIEIARQREAESKLLEERRRAQEEEEARQTREAKRRAGIASIERLEAELAVQRQSLAATRAELEAHNTRTMEYAMDHKMAIAAIGVTIGGGIVALEENGEFTEDQKAIAGISAFAVGLYALANAEECAEVADRLAKATTLQADYEGRISRASSEIEALETRIAEARAELGI